MTISIRDITFEKYRDKYSYVTLTRSPAGVLDVLIHEPGDPSSPARWNTILHSQLSYLFYEISRDYDNEVVIIRGAGDRFLVHEPSGYVPPMPAEAWDEVYHDGKYLFLNLLSIDVPVIGILNGPAPLHSELALLSDIVLAAEHATIGVGHFVWGAVPGDGIQRIFLDLLGRNRGRYHLMTGTPLSAREAKDWGLVAEVLPAQDLLDRAHHWAGYILERPKLVRRYTRALGVQDWRTSIAAEISNGLALEGLARSVTPNV